MSYLLSKRGQPDEQGCIQHITPESAGWPHVGFSAYELKPGQSLSFETTDRELCLVLVEAKPILPLTGSESGSWATGWGRSSVKSRIPSM